MAKMFWFRFWTDAHSKGKVRALSDAEFRLLTRIWGLARESEAPGTVYVVPGVGWEADELARSAGCKGGRPEAMLKRLEQLKLITLSEGGVIEVHDWADHNPPSPPSRQPAAVAEQKRREREAKRNDVGSDVGSLSDSDNLPTGNDVGTESERCPKTEKSREEKSRDHQQPMRGSEAPKEPLDTVPEFFQLLGDRLATGAPDWFRPGKEPRVIPELAAEITRVGGPAAAVDAVYEPAIGTHPRPQHYRWYLTTLRGAAGPPDEIDTLTPEEISAALLDVQVDGDRDPDLEYERRASEARKLALARRKGTECPA